MTRTSHRRRATWFRLALVASVLAAAVPAFGQVTYSYQGNNFDSFPVNPSIFDSSMSVSGSFTRPIPLPPNLPMTSVNDMDLEFTLSNGVRTFTRANSTVCDFEISTGTSSQIVAWRILLREPGVPASDPQATLFTQRFINARDGGYVSVSTGDACDPNGLGSTDAGEVVNNPGTWSSDAMAPAPTLPAAGLLLLLVLLTIAGGITLRARRET